MMIAKSRASMKLRIIPAAAQIADITAAEPTLTVPAAMGLLHFSG
jgi:hypothetical protein